MFDQEIADRLTKAISSSIGLKKLPNYLIRSSYRAEAEHLPSS
jgi:hypothetical protein